MNAAERTAWPANLPVEALDDDRLAEIAELEAFRPGLVARLVGLFRDAIAQHLPVCVDLQSGDIQAVKASAHALKGAAASVGAERLSRTAAACESSPAHVDEGSARATLPVEVEVALTALDRWSKSLGESRDRN